MEPAEHLITHAGGTDLVSVIREIDGGRASHVYEIHESGHLVAELATLSEVARYLTDG
jgi:hypothetical protein